MSIIRYTANKKQYRKPMQYRGTYSTWDAAISKAKSGKRRNVNYRYYIKPVNRGYELYSNKA